MSKNIRLLSWFNFFLDFRPYAVIAIIYFSNITHSYAWGLSIFSISMVSSALFQLPTGIFSDKFGRKKTIVYGSIASLFAIVLYAIGLNFVILAFGAILDGLGAAFYSGNNVALIRDELAEHGQEHRFAEFYGKTASMFQIALSISALIGGFIAAKSFAYVLWASVIPQIICVIISLQLTEPKPKIEKKVLVSVNYWGHLKESLQLFLENPRIRFISLGQITSYGIGETMFQFYPVFVAMLWPVWALGIFRMLDNGLAALGFWFSGKILKKYNKIKSLIVGKVLSSLTDLPAVIFPSVISPVLVSFSSFFFGLAATARGDLLQKEYSSAHRATMDSLNSLGGSIFMAVCATIFGIFADKIGPIKSLIIGNILVFLTIIFYIQLKKYYKVNSQQIAGT